ncbi:TPA: hypothetical protein N0F65_008441 [Lagenidium giganteum]|uniref:Uncharacterized protein n=1 Tax=Lagenidium giganteum TaxID=4803 RepID=A0AAV2YNT5_9STRA|nr:TPA: hypothetical protein N0F65_008441 [Lagenidium giganteum]
MFQKTRVAPQGAGVVAKSPSGKGASGGFDKHAAENGGLPVLGRLSPGVLQVGIKVWVTDPKVLWRVGEVQSIAADLQSAQVYLPDAPDDKVQTIATSKLYAFDASHIVDHDDIAQMNNMHEAPLLNVLRQRFEADKIYTFTADILLSINPYKSIPLLYDVLGFMAQIKNATDTTKRPPHLFTIADKAYTNMKGLVPGNGTAQSIIISGESGAGKTEASKYIMKYLATASKHVANGDANAKTSAATAHVHEKIEECVVLSNLILESFGNAKTSRNDNSSRFGKYIQIHYNTEGRMSGVSIRHFLLEKTRLVMPQASERNYHIFYQLLAGLQAMNEDERKHLKLREDVWNYTYLSHGDCVEIDGVDDAAEFAQLRTCMDQLGMDKASFQLPMLELLAVILQLGNVTFEAIKENGASEETTVPCFPESDGGVDLDHVAKLLGVVASEFAKKMVTQTTITGRGSILEIKLTPDQAKNAMDAFCKYLYGELFHYLITRINACAKEQTSTGTDKPRTTKSGASAAPLFIGILDIFGFEVMAKNSLEQLCINFTNESLQQQFNKHVFVLEQERYANEGIEFSIVEFKDNQPCLDLIQKPPTGLLPLLEEQMLLKRKTTDKQLLTIYHSNHLDKHGNYTKPRFECDEFVIRHYAGEVTYDVHGFIAKNTDNLHDDLLDLLRRSSQPMLQAIFNPAASGQPVKRPNLASGPQASGSKKQSAALTGTTTVTSRFRLQLSELMEVLWSTTPNYIKCIKPNNLKFPGGFSCELVRDQLIYSGVLEVVRIRQEGFPIRKAYNVFFQMFWPLVIKKYTLKSVGDDAKRLKDACTAIADQCLATGTGKKPYAMGRQEVFLRYGQLEKLEVFVGTLRDEKAVVLQATLGRGRPTFRRYQVVKKGMRKFQALWRMHVQRKQFRTMQRASVKIQAHYRRFHLERCYLQKKRAARVLYKNIVRFLMHRRFLRRQQQTKAAIRVQKHVRGYLSRTRVERARKLQLRSSLRLQCWYRMVKHHRVFVRQRVACIKVQSAYRAVTARREFLRRKNASIVLEAFMRQVLQRKKFKILKHRIVKIQALVRQWKWRKSFVQTRRAVVLLQNKLRQHHAVVLRATRWKALLGIQHAMRGWSQRCRFLKQRRGARRLQYLIRSWLLRKEFRSHRAACRRIQRAWRRHGHVRRWQQELASLFRTFHANVTTTWAHHTKMEDSDRRIQKLRENPELYVNLRPKAYGYNSLFHHAAACGDFHVVKYMLDQQLLTKEQLFAMKNARGNTAFHEACAHGQYDMVKFLLQQIKPVEVQMPTGRVVKNPDDDDVDGNQDDVEPTATKEAASKQQELVSPPPTDKPEEPEQDTTTIPPGTVICKGYLKKRRETSRWMRRYVVLSMSETHYPQLDYYANDKPGTLEKKSSKLIDLRSALFKKSIDVPFAFEIHSPQLLEKRNKEGRLYFAAENELEIQKWLAALRDSIPSTIESRIFAMHRASRCGRLEFVDFAMRKQICNEPATSARKETPLHLVASVVVNGTQAQPGRPHLGISDSFSPVSASTTSIVVEDDHSNNNNNSNNNNGNISSLAINTSNWSSNHLLQVGEDPAQAQNPEDAHLSKIKMDMEVDVVKTALWLLENGADINAKTTKRETALKLAFRSNNLLLAKHLLGRGALTSGLSAAELEEVQRMKSALAKSAISSVGSSLASAPLSPSQSFKKKVVGGASAESDAPVLFLLKQPGKVRHSSYVSVFVELIGISSPQLLSRPRIVISVLDPQRNMVEMKQQVSVQPMTLTSALVWAFTWHMQTPLENLPHGACIVFELTITPTVSTAGGGPASGAPASAADDYVPVCWTYVQVDQRTANSMPLNAEMYKYPMDLTLKKLQRVDAFITGDMYISQGPH